jgi:hypothetical protein
MGTWCENSSQTSKMGEGRTMKTHGDLKVDIHPIGDVVDIV